MTDYMREAIKEAKKAFNSDEVPIGCVIVHDGKIIARAYNKKTTDNDSLAHAEMLAIKKAEKKLNTKYLQDCSMYVTSEPCCMCAGAIVNVRLGELHYALEEPKTGCCGSVYNMVEGNFNHSVSVKRGERREEALALMQEFFRQKRKK